MRQPKRNLTPVVAVAALTFPVGLTVAGWPGLFLLCVIGGLGAVCLASSALIPGGHRRSVASTGCLLVLWYVVVGSVLTALLPQSDSLGYYSTAVSISGHEGGHEVAAVANSGREGYVQVLAAIFRLGEPGFMVLVGYSAAVLAVTYVIMVRAVHDGFGESAVKYVGPLFALSPSLLLWGTQGLRESSIYLILSGLCALSVSFRNRMSVPKLVAILALISVLLFFRGGIAPVLGIAIIVGVVASASGLRRRPQYVLLAGMVVVLGWTIFNSYGGAPDLQQSYYDAERVDRVRGSLGRADSGFDVQRISPRTLFVGLLRVGAGPFPWEWARFPLAIPDSIYWIGLMLCVIPFVARVGIRVNLVYIIPALALAISTSIGVTNYGTMIRLRTMALIFLLPVVCGALARRGSRRRLSQPTRTSGNGP